MDYREIAETALRERANIFEQRKALNDSDATDAEKREGFERMDADMDRLAAEAREAVEAGEREAETRDLMTRAGALSLPEVDKRTEQSGPSLNDNLRALARGELRSVDFTAAAEAFEKRFTATVDSTNGTGSAAEVTPDTFVATLLKSMEETSDVLSLVRGINTAGGELMEWPRRVSKVSGTFKKIVEAGAYQRAADGSFTKVPLNAFKFGAIAEVSEEALNDPALNIGAIVAEEMGEDLAESLAREIWVGTGLTENVLDTVGQTSPFAAAGAITEDELIDLQHAITQKYRRNARWFLNDDTARFVRKIKDGNEHYLWQPALTAGAPDMLLGKPVSTELNMPDMAASGRSVIFGDVHRYYTLRTVRNIGIVRSDEYGFDRDTVALKIKWRGDGAVMDPLALAAGVHAAA